MRYINTLLVLCLILLLFTSCDINVVEPELAVGNLEVQEDTEDPVIVDPEDPEMIYPQKWATGDGKDSNP